MKTLAYVFGPPGSGKTSLMNSVCAFGRLLYNAKDPIKHCGYSSEQGNFIVLGAKAVPFGGTDTLSYTAGENANKWLAKLAKCSMGGLVFAEGDRLANTKFFQEVTKHYRLLPFYLNCSSAVSIIKSCFFHSPRALVPVISGSTCNTLPVVLKLIFVFN
jgi:hypothetical protein